MSARRSFITLEGFQSGYNRLPHGITVRQWRYSTDQIFSPLTNQEPLKRRLTNQRAARVAPTNQKTMTSQIPKKRSSHPGAPKFTKNEKRIFSKKSVRCLSDDAIDSYWLNWRIGRRTVRLGTEMAATSKVIQQPIKNHAPTIDPIINHLKHFPPLTPLSAVLLNL